jgi:pSer/pThr/pTyr-binding forkhead associated (FHA) protein
MDDRNPDEPADRTRTADVLGGGGGAPPPMQQGVFLVILHETGDKKAVLLLPGKPVVVGRDLPSDICIPDPELSRKHAQFTLLDNEVVVQDLGSKNGTHIADRRIARDTIPVSGEVMLGRKTFARITAFGMVVDTAAVCTPAATWNESVAPLDDNALIFGKKMQELLANIDRIAKSDFSVLLHGETGTGKEVIAAQIHERGPRRQKVFKAVNCGAIHENLIESELFGHEKNSFTGAAGRKEGFFEVTDGGTLFLDEIGDLPTAAQAKLLRVLDSGRFYRLGSTEEVEVDVRIIAATHHNLKDMVEEGRFRKDLYFRLNALVVQIPPLRERKDEIEPLCRLFLRDNKTVSQRVRGISEEAMRLLRRGCDSARRPSARGARGGTGARGCAERRPQHGGRPSREADARGGAQGDRREQACRGAEARKIPQHGTAEDQEARHRPPAEVGWSSLT